MEWGTKGGRPSTESCGDSSDSIVVGNGVVTSSTRVSRQDTSTVVEGQQDGSTDKSDKAVDMMSVCVVR